MSFVISKIFGWLGHIVIASPALCNVRSRFTKLGHEINDSSSSKNCEISNNN